jgi:hypothetical protein
VKYAYYRTSPDDASQTLRMRFAHDEVKGVQLLYYTENGEESITLKFNPLTKNIYLESSERMYVLPHGSTNLEIVPESRINEA